MTNSRLSDLLASDKGVEHVHKKSPAHPKGWEPGFEWDGKKGTIVSDPTGTATQPAFEALLAELCAAIGADPSLYQIVGDIQIRRWQQKPGDDYLYYHRATIGLRSDSADAIDVDVDKLGKVVGSRKARVLAPANGPTGLVIALADWQIGKSDGDGVEGTMARLDDMVGQVQELVRDLKRLGRPPAVIYPCFMGDLFESCSGHYAQQEFRTLLNIRDQRKVIRWAADRLIDSCSSLAPAVGVKVVGGNHGEERQNGKSYTDFADNRDVAVIEDIAWAYSQNPDRYGHVNFAIPHDDLTLTFDHEGTIVGLAHSHQAGFGSGDPRAKIDRWWKGQMAGQQPIGDADILVTAHWHHPWMLRSGTRTHFGCPALDGGSDWFRNYSGMDSPPGTLTFTIGPNGWDDFKIIAGVRCGEHEAG